VEDAAAGVSALDPGRPHEHGPQRRGPLSFLDYRVVEWAARLPQDLKLGPNMDEKWILKQAFPDTLPPNILKKPKQPYRAPDLSAFLGSHDADYTEALFSEHELAKLPFLNGAFCQQFLKKVRNAPPGGISQRENQAFILLLSTALLHRYFVAARLPAARGEAEPRPHDRRPPRLA
jgi:asparagine synthase (glutamine-hydrolysing)